MNTDLFQSDADATPLNDEEKLGLKPSLTTRAELNQLERQNIHAARLWALKPRQLQRDDLLTDAFARELHRRMFNHVWRWAGRYRTTEKNLGWEVHRLVEGVRNACDDARGGEELTWGAKADLVEMSEIRRRYIAAVRVADDGDFKALVEFARS